MAYPNVSLIVPLDSIPFPQLEQLAESEGISVESVIRRAIDAELETKAAA